MEDKAYTIVKSEQSDSWAYLFNFSSNDHTFTLSDKISDQYRGLNNYINSNLQEILHLDNKHTILRVCNKSDNSHDQQVSNLNFDEVHNLIIIKEQNR